MTTFAVYMIKGGNNQARLRLDLKSRKSPTHFGQILATCIVTILRYEKIKIVNLILNIFPNKIVSEMAPSIEND